MPCKDCFNKCGGLFTTDQCSEYTGPSIPLLGICTGDRISDVNAIIIEKLIAALDGTGIVLSDLTIECTFLKDILGTKDKTLANLIQVLFDAGCSLKTLLDQAIAAVGAPISFQTDCLTLPANPTKDQILQAAVTKLCAVAADVAAIKADYVKASQLNNLIQLYLTNNSGSTVQYYLTLPPYVAMPYFGDLSNFDNTGKGLDSKGFKNIYLCNGNNGAPDLRGFGLVGAVSGVPGVTLDPLVDPAQPDNGPNTNYALLDKFGKPFVKLSVNEIPSHSHPVVDPGHDHNLPSGIQFQGTVSGGEGGTNDKQVPTNQKTGKSTTGITIGSTGGGQSHENRQPSKACHFIMVKY
jgi:microcystin-dependent protein